MTTATAPYSTFNLPHDDVHLTGGATLTADDLKALRAADDHIAFFVDWDRNQPGKVFSYIRAAAAPKQQGPFEAATVDRIIPMRWRATRYATLHGYDDTRPAWVCTITSPMYNSAWRTAVACLKPGDELWGWWFTDNNHKLLDDAGFSADEFQLCVHRTGRTGADGRSSTRELVFNLDHRTLPSSSPGRYHRR